MARIQVIAVKFINNANEIKDLDYYEHTGAGLVEALEKWFDYKRRFSAAWIEIGNTRVDDDILDTLLQYDHNGEKRIASAQQLVNQVSSGDYAQTMQEMKRLLLEVKVDMIHGMLWTPNEESA